MNEAHAPGKFSKWKQPLMGGLRSAIPAAVFIGATIVLFYADYDADWIYIFYDIISLVSIGFLLPNLIYLFVTSSYPTSDFLALLLVVLFWFIVGFVITALSKNSKIAGRWWLGFYIISLVILIINIEQLFPL